jgi:hypothetical protein
MNNMQIGEQYGYLEVIELCQDKKAICKCHNCGKTNFKTKRQSLRSGRTGSCGCSKDRYVKTTGKNNKQFTGYEDIRGQFFAHIKRHAESRNLKFLITIQYAWDLYEQQKRKCALSGLPIIFGVNGGGKTTASLDRIDSELGYVEGNVQWVHKFVNKMKWNIPQKEFVELCKSITIYQKEKPR